LRSLNRALAALALIRPTGRWGFCPACRLVVAAPTGQPRGAEVELALPAVTVLAFLVVAAIAWALMIGQSRGSGEMAMGPGSLASFIASWVVMMAAMMLPSAMPLVFEFAQNSEGRRGWPAATGVLAATYLSIWLAFGLACYMARNAFPMSWPNQGMVGGLALVLAGLYGLTPIKRASEARCRELCALHGPLPFNLMRSALVVGAKYGLSCVGCSAALMAAMVIIGMSNLIWAVILSGMVLVYKLAPAPSLRQTLLLSAALGALGVVYVLMT
jgi:predicted metal-binding membrane protein